ncbi:Rgg family transcriptional regulator [Lapidilactobacillus gannanensis]|uniref:HTH-type transcriptional regulator Rgg C-terminal domain-containing protein n=1 Tax=Lapidilactobacillus gannanensis TaxID=2486002 RepID=A0ABW4BN18_9LACO
MNLPNAQYQTRLIHLQELINSNQKNQFIQELNDYQSEHANDNNIQYRLNQIMFKSIGAHELNLPEPSTAEIKFLVTYFWQCEYWSHYDLTIFGNTAYLLDPELRVQLLKEIIKLIEMQVLHGINTRDPIRIVINTIFDFFHSENYRRADILIQIIAPIIPNNYVFEKGYLLAAKVILVNHDRNRFSYEVPEPEELLKLIKLIDSQGLSKIINQEFKDQGIG